ncbi:DUF461 domain-containing protein [Kitasatospora sp. CM 4170]|uniref:DUF461 domain-containing protein n=1 Tax=Kitasatospora aburaviensis TaxID=67265 RepID=A0ABW1EXX7_9ACTN|nr:DUF461 domain-containing protein [Kitasatospora sp. CM 4170]WNM46474.1 DUF461 domain-containing protein [Kitasatospora sp. CM 4170]
MSRSLRVGSIAAIAALAIASLSACSAGNTAETLEIKPDNASATIGTDLLMNNIVVVTGDESSGEHTGPANVTVNISNTGELPAELQSIAVGNASAALADDKGAPLTGIVIPAHGAVAIGGAGNPSARVASVTLSVGGFVPTTFTFKSGRSVQTEASVYPNKGLYKGFGPTASPVAVPTKAASPAAAGTATATGAATAPATGAATAPAAGATAPAGAATATGTASPAAGTH